MLSGAVLRESRQGLKQPKINPHSFKLVSLQLSKTQHPTPYFRGMCISPGAAGLESEICQVQNAEPSVPRIASEHVFTSEDLQAVCPKFGAM